MGRMLSLQPSAPTFSVFGCCREISRLDAAGPGGLDTCTLANGTWVQAQVKVQSAPGFPLTQQQAQTIVTNINLVFQNADPPVPPPLWGKVRPDRRHCCQPVSMRCLSSAFSDACHAHLQAPAPLSYAAATLG